MGGDFAVLDGYHRAPPRNIATFAEKKIGNADPMETLDEEASLREVLAELTYPAEKWEVTTLAQIWGVDTETRRRLHALPARTFDSLDDITEALPERVPH
jgi:hypothetical protein